MLTNNTRFLIDRSSENDRWRILDGGKEVAHASTYDGAVKAAKEIEAKKALSQAAIDQRPNVEPQGTIRKLLWRSGLRFRKEIPV